ncbi:hypothetical protein HPB48_012578 [Haemaphysalis longicornis]|uniref:Uncharacterized protein n=1 Tax=Haemaphysalis longicornis TaxID=44386 RepID=A0A9J6GL19_HAELO|nr:hypothetical protein HPB48_012578 [Haemaphysalis longicornis]
MVMHRFEGRWSDMTQAPSAITYWDTGVEPNLLKYVGARSVQVPRDATVHPHLNKVLINERLRKIEEGTNLEWATAEALALGSLLFQGFNVRICGQDVGRGTFSQRHAILVDRTTEQHLVPPQQPRPGPRPGTPGPLRGIALYLGWYSSTFQLLLWLFVFSLKGTD